MYVSFDELSPQARVWVYQSDRRLKQEELSLIEREASAFLETWATHGKPLKASFRLFYEQFLVVSVEEAEQAASGCSIDSSVSFVRMLEKELDVNFMDRTKVAFLHDREVLLEALPQLKGSIEKGRINAKTPTFNNLVANKQELEEKWLLPAEETWLKRYF